MNQKEYLKNRAQFPPKELLKFDGQWVGFSMDGRRIIASNEDLVTLDSLVVAGSEDPENAAFERIEMDDTCLGGAELL